MDSKFFMNEIRILNSLESSISFNIASKSSTHGRQRMFYMLREQMLSFWLQQQKYSR